MRNRREHYYFMKKLMELNLVEKISANQEGTLFICNLCGKKVIRTKLLFHFRNNHSKLNICKLNNV